MFTVSHDYYGILGVSKNATFEEIRRQYRKLVREHHPDQFNGLRAKYQDKGDEDLLKVIDEKIREAGEKSKLLNEAFEVLSDPVKRKQYDGQVVEPSVSLPEISIYPTRIAFGSLLEGQEKSLVFTIENKGGPPATVNIDWEGNKPDWGELAIEPDAENVFPIKVTVKVDTTGIPSGPKDEKILVDVDGRIHMVEVFLAVTSPVVAPATPTRASPPPTPPAKTSFTFPKIRGDVIAAFVMIFVASMFWIIAASSNQQQRARSQQVWTTQTAVAQKQLLEATEQVKATGTAVAYEQQLQEQQQQEELKRAALIAQFRQDPSSLVKINIRRGRDGKGNSPHILFMTVANNSAYWIGIYGKTGPGNDDSQSLLDYSVGPGITTEIVVGNHYYDNLPQLCLTLIMFDHESEVGSAAMCIDIPKELATQ